MASLLASCQERLANDVPLEYHPGFLWMIAASYTTERRRAAHKDSVVSAQIDLDVIVLEFYLNLADFPGEFEAWNV
jgi:hypothetical protein